MSTTGPALDQRLGGFWRRALGALLDALLLTLLLAVTEVAYLVATGEWVIDAKDPNQPLLAAAVALIAALYDVGATRAWGGTLGKRAAGVRVQAREGGPASTAQVVARLLGRLVSLLPALLGFLWAGWDRRKQTWHDKLADTVVVRERGPVPVLPTEAEPALANDGVEAPWSAPPAMVAAVAQIPFAGPATEPPPASVWSPGAPAAQPAAWSPQPATEGLVPVPGALAPPPSPRHDANLVAISRAGLGHDAAVWLGQVAAQVDTRLDRLSPVWRGSPHAEAARACAFGLLLGHLARLYPHMRPELHATAELHPSYTTLLEGARLATLEQIAAEPLRMAAWIGPLIDVVDAERVRVLLD